MHIGILFCYYELIRFNHVMFQVCPYFCQRNYTTNRMPVQKLKPLKNQNSPTTSFHLLIISTSPSLGLLANALVVKRIWALANQWNKQIPLDRIALWKDPTISFLCDEGVIYFKCFSWYRLLNRDSLSHCKLWNHLNCISECSSGYISGSICAFCIKHLLSR